MTRDADEGSVAAYLERRAVLEGEIARLRDAIERARAAAGAATSDERRASGRRLSEENDDLRRENAELAEKIRASREQRRTEKKRKSTQGIEELFDFLARLFNR